MISSQVSFLHPTISPSMSVPSTLSRLAAIMPNSNGCWADGNPPSSRPAEAAMAHCHTSFSAYI